MTGQEEKNILLSGLVLGFWSYDLLMFFTFAFLSLLPLSLLIHCGRIIPPGPQSDSFSKDAVLTQIELKRTLQKNDTPHPLPIDIKTSPDEANHFLIVLPEHAQDNTISTNTTALRPVLTGNYFYASVTIGQEEKIIGKGPIDFSGTNPATIHVFSEANASQSYTIAFKKEPFPQAPPQAFDVGVTLDSSGKTLEASHQEIKVHRTLTGSYRYADMNFDQESESTFRWLISDSSAGGFEAIPGANSIEYSTKARDGGKYLKFEVTPIALRGTPRGRVYTSLAVGPVEPLFGLGLAQSKIRIVEIGRYRNGHSKNDYILLYNPEDASVKLNGLYVGRDARCNLNDNSVWSSYDALPQVSIAAMGYYLISRAENDIGADDSSWGSLGNLTGAASYCIVLANSSTKPTHARFSNVLDFVAFGTTAIPGEGGENAPALPRNHILRRKMSCENSPQDTNHNLNDFELIDVGSEPENTYRVRSSLVTSCTMEKEDGGMDGNGMEGDGDGMDGDGDGMDGDGMGLAQSKIRIVEIGRYRNGHSKNDYILLYNPEDASVKLNGLYVGRDARCNLNDNSVWSNYDALPQVSIAAMGYYLISRAENDIGADETSWSSLGNLTGAASYCIVLANSSTKPTHAGFSNVLDFVAFGTTVIPGEGGENAPALPRNHILRRKMSCENSPQDTNHNLNDFELIDVGSEPENTYRVRSSLVTSCTMEKEGDMGNDSDGMGLAQSKIRIVEIGRYRNGHSKNDYILLYNPEDASVKLNGLYVGRDARCNLNDNSVWSSYDALPQVSIAAMGYYLISRAENDIGADETSWGSLGNLTGAASYCIVLANSSTKPTHAGFSNVLDFVAFGTTVIPGEGGENAPALPRNHILRRKMSCENSPQDTNHNLNDFELIDVGSKPENTYRVRSSLVTSCTMEKEDGGMDGNGMEGDGDGMDGDGMDGDGMDGDGDGMGDDSDGGSTGLVIAEVGNKINNNANNDYILLYNNTDSAVDLSAYYIGRDSGCTISEGKWTEYEKLSDTIPAHGYFLIARASSGIEPDLTWSGAISSNYCVVLSDRNTPPNSAADSGVIDFVSFKAGIGEGGERAGVLADKSYFRRMGSCSETDTNHNASDFQRTPNINSGYRPKNSSHDPCTP